MVGEDGSDPSLSPYQSDVLPLNYSPIMEGLENFEISTFCLRGRCSSSELQALGTPHRICTRIAWFEARYSVC
jgi:hypothetical protein